MKQGFMLIELIVATLVASMVAAILLAALTQGNRFQMLVDDTIDNSLRIGVVSNQLQKDLMGAFIPVQAEKPAETGKDAQKEESGADKAKKSDDKKSPAKKDEPADKGGLEKKEEKPIEKIFYSTNKNGKFDTLTFVTNNPLSVFVGKDVGVVKPKVVRVQYNLKAEAGKKDSYALFRQESMELDLAKYKDVREYEVIGGIKNCTMTFTARIEKKDESSSAKATADASSKKDAKVQYEYKTLNEWVSEQKKDAEKDKDKAEFPRIPYSVEIKLALWDMQDKKEKDYTIVCSIPVDFSAPKKEDKKQQPEQPKKEEAQPAQPPKAGTNKQAMMPQSNQAGGNDVQVYNLEILANKLQNLTKLFGRT